MEESWIIPSRTRISPQPLAHWALLNRSSSQEVVRVTVSPTWKLSYTALRPDSSPAVSRYISGPISTSWFPVKVSTTSRVRVELTVSWELSVSPEKGSYWGTTRSLTNQPSAPLVWEETVEKSSLNRYSPPPAFRRLLKWVREVWVSSRRLVRVMPTLARPIRSI